MYKENNATSRAWLHSKGIIDIQLQVFAFDSLIHDASLNGNLFHLRQRVENAHLIHFLEVPHVLVILSFTKKLEVYDTERGRLWQACHNLPRSVS